MIRTYQAELAKLVRRRLVLITAIVVAVSAVGGAAVVLASAKPAASFGASLSPSLEELSGAGGGSEIFRTVASFTGTLIFVMFVGIVAVEFARGTIRTMLLRQPGRVRLLAGKLAALLTVAAVTLAAAEVLTWVAAWALAPGQNVDTQRWTSLDALGAAATDYGAILLWVTGYAVLGTTVAVLLRSVPVALAVGVAWAGPFEHLLQDAWQPASDVFPGLNLEQFVAGGTAEVSVGQALVTVVVYSMVAAVVAAVVFTRWDVTA